MTITSDESAPGDRSFASGVVVPLSRRPLGPDGTPADAFQASIARHPSALVRHLDTYLAAVARELQARGVRTGAPQRSDPAHRLFGSIVLDGTALRPLSAVIQPERPAPFVATWDEVTGWCVGLHHDLTHSTRRYLHPDLLPVPTAVAEFVVGLVLGQPLGSTRPITAAAAGGPRLRLVTGLPARPDHAPAHRTAAPEIP